jgi:hypothetical protein
MTNQEQSKAPQAAPKDEGLTRRAAMKRIAAGLAGVGVVVVAGIIGSQRGIYQPLAGKDQYGDSAPKNRQNPSSPLAGKDQYGDSAPK